MGRVKRISSATDSPFYREAQVLSPAFVARDLRSACCASCRASTRVHIIRLRP